MLWQYQVIQVLFALIPFWIDISLGQVLFENSNTHSSDASCLTPDGRRGNCIRWTKCININQKLTWDQLRPFLCGFAGTEPNVCCPSIFPPEISSPPLDRISPVNNNSRTENITSEHKPILTLPKTNPSESSDKDGKPSFLPDDCGLSAFTDNRVIGGRKAEKGSWPWMVVIFQVKRSGFKSSDCGGALVTANHVITAAHCAVKRNTITPLDPKRLMVRLGVHDLGNANDSDAIDIGVDAVRIHERYDPRVHRNDIAVIRLSQLAPFSNSTSPVCLPYDSLRNEDLSGKSSTVTGFGLTSVNGSYSDVLMEVSFDIQDQEMCRRTYASDLRITNEHLCAGTLDGSKDSCQGDSGGPLVTFGKRKRYYLIGIVSFGKKCALPGYPGVYTRVTEFLDWLTLNLAN
ncbi:Proclotting enzyme like protein [Argiope bruennichi]|uniref:CLIP domain-containing serine protease n=2 Tax=Argiope bruennichi TaxID=94029 RepID=A0A8T0FF03_ARGBR|nr:Proclotting enzyme like protein [Argiope bruennichi]